MKGSVGYKKCTIKGLLWDLRNGAIFEKQNSVRIHNFPQFQGHAIFVCDALKLLKGRSGSCFYPPKKCVFFCQIVQYFVKIGPLVDSLGGICWGRAGPTYLKALTTENPDEPFHNFGALKSVLRRSRTR